MPLAYQVAGHQLRWRSFGSRASRRESPKRLKPNTARLIATPGKMASHGAFSAYIGAPPESISPQEGSVRQSPAQKAQRRFRQDGAAKLRRGHDQIERHDVRHVWRNITRMCEPPTARAAST